MGWIYNGLEEQGLERKYTDWQLLKKVMKGVTPFKIPFILTVFMVLAGTILQLVSPLVLADTISL